MHTLSRRSSLLSCIAARNGCRRGLLAAVPLIAALGATIALSTVARAQSIVNSSFETPAQSGGYTYDPTGAGVGWNFTGNSGITANGNAFTGGNANAPDGIQVAFVQGLGSMSQSISGFSAGTYSFSFMATQRANGGTEPSSQTLSVTVDGTAIGSFTPSSASASYQTFTTYGIMLAAGSHTLQFTGTASPANGGPDYTAFVDKVSTSISSSAAAPEPAALLLLAPGGLGMVGMISARRRRKAGSAA